MEFDPPSQMSDLTLAETVLRVSISSCTTRNQKYGDASGGSSGGKAAGKRESIACSQSRTSDQTACETRINLARLLIFITGRCLPAVFALAQRAFAAAAILARAASDILRRFCFGAATVPTVGDFLRRPRPRLGATG